VYVVIATNPVHRVQILPPTIPTSYIRVRVQCGNAARTNSHTDARGQYTFRLGYASRLTELLQSLTTKDSENRPATGEVVASGHSGVNEPLQLVMEMSFLDKIDNNTTHSNNTL